MGTTVSAQTNHTHPYVVAVNEMNSLAFKYQRMPWLWIKPIRQLIGYEADFQRNLDIVTSFTKKVIDRKLREHDETDGMVVVEEESKKKAFLDMLIEVRLVFLRRSRHLPVSEKRGRWPRIRRHSGGSRHLHVRRP